MWLPIVLSSIAGAFFGSIAARVEYFVLLRRMQAIEGLLRGFFAQNARREKKDAVADVLREFKAPFQTPDQILAEAARKGMM